MDFRRRAVVIVCFGFSTLAAGVRAEFVVGPPPTGEEIAAASSFGRDARVIATHYFYWYDWPTQHFFDDTARRDSALRHHFTAPESVSYKSKAWHKKQARDMLAAGVDALLCVYWGAPNQYECPDIRFSIDGLPPLVAALDELATEGTAPKVGLFYDTSTLLGKYAFDPPRPGGVDLRTAEGREIFYHTIRDFFCQVPPRHWLCLDGRPVVQLYGAGFAEGHDQRTIDYVYEQFEQDFAGLRPFVITGPSWAFQGDGRTGWGASLSGPIIGRTIAQIGPGYDDSPVPERTTATRDRLGGGYYAGSWLLALQAEPRMVIIETWNELHEGTGICPSLEDGRTYVELTRRYADRYHMGEGATSAEWAEVVKTLIAAQPSRPGGRAFASSLWLDCSISPTGDVVENGLRLDTGQADGRFEIEARAGRQCVRSRRGISPYRFLYFDVADPYYYDHSGTVTLEITYLDEGRVPIEIEFDAVGAPRTIATRYRKHKAALPREDTGQWRTKRLELAGARFANGQNGGCDFRLVSEHADMAIAAVRLTKLTPPYLQRDGVAR